MSLSKIVALK